MGVRRQTSLQRAAKRQLGATRSVWAADRMIEDHMPRAKTRHRKSHLVPKPNPNSDPETHLSNSSAMTRS